MIFRNKNLFLRFLTIFFAIYGVLWISLEGALWQVMLMGVLATLLIWGHGIQRWLQNREFSRIGWAFLWAGLGGSAGISLPVIIFAFMSIKTGLHAHGPEFLAEDILWVFQQWWVWGSAGIIAGLGIALFTIE